jgi:hypothetical protein
MEKSTYKRHASKKMNYLYAQKPYQGANPIDAQILFVGRDANWADDIETQEIFIFIGIFLMR